MQWYTGLAECEVDCGFPARSDFRKFYLLSLYRDIAFAIKNPLSL